MGKKLAPSPKIKYPTYTDCLRFLFGFLKQHYNFDPIDKLPNYRKEDPHGLKKILKFCRNDNYYSSLSGKAAYIFVGLIEGHYYSNGNKRLALVITLYFLALNGYSIKEQKPRELYNLALFVADKQKNNDMSFDALKKKAEQYFGMRLTNTG